MSPEHAPSPKMLRVPAVMARTGLSRTTIYRRVRAGTFPAPMDLGNGLIGWTDSVIDTWQRDLPSVWCTVYEELSEGKPGLLGAMTARAEAQVMRIACIYALLDFSSVIRVEHLMAALAVWDYADASAEYIFGKRMGDPAADRIVDALLQSPNGMTRTDISDLFGRNKSADDIDRALRHIKSAGRAQCAQETTGGRSVERWTARRSGA